MKTRPRIGPVRPGLDSEALVRLIDLTYEAAQDPLKWHGCLQAVATAVSGRGAILLHHDLRDRGSVVESIGIDPEALGLYNAHYHAVDVWARSPRAKNLAVPGRAVPDEWLVERSELKKSEHYADFVAPFDLTRMVSLTLARDQRHSGITIFRSERDKGFADVELHFLEALIPHFRRALQIGVRLQAADGERRALLDGLEALACAVLLTDASGRVLATNRAGAALAIAIDGIGVTKGVLTAASMDVTNKLRALCASATLSAPGHQDRGGALLVPRPGNAIPMHVLVAPTTRAMFDVSSTGAMALVFISDPSVDKLQPDEGLLCKYYGLTKTEAQVAARLALGHSLDEIASDRRLTRETVRWYSKQVLAKTGSSNRAELVRRLTKSLSTLNASLTRDA